MWEGVVHTYCVNGLPPSTQFPQVVSIILPTLSSQNKHIPCIVVFMLYNISLHLSILHSQEEATLTIPKSSCMAWETWMDVHGGSRSCVFVQSQGTCSFSFLLHYFWCLMVVECFTENNYSDNVHVVTASSHLNFNIFTSLLQASLPSSSICLITFLSTYGCELFLECNKVHNIYPSLSARWT